MIEKGINIRELQAQNGHSNIGITEKYLQRLNDFSNEKFKELSNSL
jgi:integrase